MTKSGRSIKVGQSVIQTVRQSVRYSVRQSVSQSGNQSDNQSFSQTISQSDSKEISQSGNQSFSHSDSPAISQSVRIKSTVRLSAINKRKLLYLYPFNLDIVISFSFFGKKTSLKRSAIHTSRRNW